MVKVIESLVEGSDITKNSVAEYNQAQSESLASVVAEMQKIWKQISTLNGEIEALKRR